MWDKASNLRAYTNIEQMCNYKNAEELNNYRQHLLKKSGLQSEFIKSYFNNKIKVFEACSGNSRLLYRLFMDSILEEGIGVEISSSRVVFAEEWKKQFPEAPVSNICSDIIKFEGKEDYFDLAVCITGALGYFYPIDKLYPDVLLSKLYKMLKKDGFLLLELYQHVNDIKFCMMNEVKELKRWLELPESDPFRFYLTKFLYHEIERCLECKEIFVRRDGYIDDSKNEVLKIYSIDEISNMLTVKGFKIENMYSEWDKEENSASSDKLIIMARKM